LFDSWQMQDICSTPKHWDKFRSLHYLIFNG